MQRSNNGVVQYGYPMWLRYIFQDHLQKRQVQESIHSLEFHMGSTDTDSMLRISGEIRVRMRQPFMLML